jgi:alpha-glucan,water dikinase
MAEPMIEEVTASLGEGLSYRSAVGEHQLTLVIGIEAAAECVLHWGLVRDTGGAWQRPPEAYWPAGTTGFDASAVRTPFSPLTNGERQVVLRFDQAAPARKLAFVVHFPRENRWLKTDGRDFVIALPSRRPGVPLPEQALATWLPGSDISRQVIPLDGGDRLAVAVSRATSARRVALACDCASSLALHWGLAWRFRDEWQLPPEAYRPAGSTLFDQNAVRTPFSERDGLKYLELHFPNPPEGKPPVGLKFLLFRTEDAAYLKSGGKDLFLRLFEAEGDSRISPRHWSMAEQIVAAEMGASSWTLMHRFNLCHDLLEEAQADGEALALLFAWLRYSATRQLDWQRRYNTKPRELAHAQDRLTLRLARLFRQAGGKPNPGEDRSGALSRGMWARLLLTTLGRGGEGQRVRDEILHIMHRNHLKEVNHTFVEEWHQKLHNNTTPDDVVICEAYLAFLRNNGDLALFYQTLEAGGVSRDRLASFERPIKTDPVFFPDKKEDLTREFETFLRILKSVHAGTDLDSAVGAARARLSEAMNRQLETLLTVRNQEAAEDKLLPLAAAVREGLREALAGAKDDAAVRDLLYLDLAVEDLLRGVIERQPLGRLDRDILVKLAGWALRNLSFSVEAPELALCVGHWTALASRPRDGRDWALHAKSVTDRAARWVQGFTNELYQQLQPRAEFLGEAFAVNAWTVPLFSEEVIRGGPAFALSLVLRPLDRLLRNAAGLGGWQIISPGQAFGRVRVVDRLLAEQGERFSEPTVLVVGDVAGNEEIPEGVTAVITASEPDLLSHVSVRARNGHVLFATCFDSGSLEQLKALNEKSVALHLTSRGDVEISEGSRQEGVPAVAATRPPISSRDNRRVFTPASEWAIRQDQFTDKLVGGKSNNLSGLRGRLSDWIRYPVSIALPFGTFEKTLADEKNRSLGRQADELIARAEQDPPQELARLRELLLELTPPAGLRPALLSAWQQVGLSAISWEQSWTAIRRVWASKWNERAYLSRRARGIPHASLLMAVLIQEVVAAEYAFVIHTRNPMTGNRDEVYAEVVLGLGETLVGNYPGRALGFVYCKAYQKVELVSYPGKSVGLYGKGVIFRSDSNGEDLEDFAGAGLYDSFLAEEPEHRLLDYRGQKLVWDQNFRDELLRSIGRIGLEVERALGSPQDIEGAVTGGQFYVVQTRPQVGLG